MLQKIKTRNPGLMMVGRMLRLKGRAVPPGPRISPDVQGGRAYDLLNAEQKARLEYALENEARILGVGKNDLQWLFDQHNALHIKRARVIDLRNIRCH